MEEPDVPAQERGPQMSSSPRTSREWAGGCPAQAKLETTSVTRKSRTSGGVSAKGCVGCTETMPDELQPSPTTQPQELTAFKPLYPRAMSAPMATSNLGRTVGEHCKASTCTEFVTQAAEAFWSSELNTQGDMIGGSNGGGIGADDWLDVTRAIGRFQFDSC